MTAGREQNAMPLPREAIAHSESLRDFVTRDLFSEILEAEEDQVDFIETQLELDEDRIDQTVKLGDTEEWTGEVLSLLEKGLGCSLA